MPSINFYHDFFAQGKPAYVEIEFMEFREAVGLVKNLAAELRGTEPASSAKPMCERDSTGSSESAT